MFFSIVRRSFSSSMTSKLLLTLTTPSTIYYNCHPVHSITVPGVQGVLTLTNYHPPGITELKPGLITVDVNTDEKKKFFMTNGFLFYDSPRDYDRCCTAHVCVVEMAELDRLCKTSAQKLLDEFKSMPCKTEWEKARSLLVICLEL